MNFTSIDELQSAMRAQQYIAERGLATSLYLALKLSRPLFLEGEAGVGKTEVVKILAALPNIGNFLLVHNLASLEDLATRLADLDKKIKHEVKTLASGARAGEYIKDENDFCLKDLVND